MQIAISDEEIEEFMNIINRIAQDHPILVDKYLQGKEIEVDAVCDGKDILIPGIMEHIERTGVHSGDSISVYPAPTISDTVKEKIAEYAAGLIQAGDFVYLDAGTTTEFMIDYITERRAVFVTNAIIHAKKLAEKGFTVYILGGEFKAVTEAIVGEEAVVTLEKYNFTKGFWGTNGVSLQKGFSTPELKEALVKKKSMESCQNCYVLADKSKFNQISSVTFAAFENATVITNDMATAAFQKCKNIINL